MITLDRLDKAIKKIETDIAIATEQYNSKENKALLEMVRLRTLLKDFRSQSIKLDKLLFAMGI